MKLGLVLGGGGLVGMGYHAGVIKALDEFGVDVNAADVIVGTSAGSIIGSYLAAGWQPRDFYDYAQGEHPDSRRDKSEQKDEVRRIFIPLWTDPLDRARRTVGSLFTLASSRGYWSRASRGRVPGRAWQKGFPSGLYSTDEARERLHNDLPVEWPRDNLYICTVELYSGRRVAFGHPDAPEAPLPDAVLASTAIPGIFPPVRIGDALYVDGGAYSATSLDLATNEACTSIICIAPLGYKSDGLVTARDPKIWFPMLARALFARALRREVIEARACGIDVLVLRPGTTELKTHGTNAMRYFDRAAFTEDTRVSTLKVLEKETDHPALRAWMTRSTAEKAG
jgi:NTE family protein